ncbi:MAG TPA: ribosome-associated translation inhibitor RaiA [Acidobacteriaceae bacterium]|jgi:putative sigma-54 modulation protein|nr:ribosome-associated translation inhibitor RaiA [Acidobacteriaceae bacterium]
MQTEFTGRQQKVGKSLRTLADEGLSRIEKVLGRTASAHVTFSMERYRHIVEVTIRTRLQIIVGVAVSSDAGTALRNALEKAEKQALRLKKRKIQLHRQSKDKTAAKVQAAPGKRAVSSSKLATSPALVEEIAVELHVVPSKESVARRPMSIHEAVKEAEYRDREVFVFKDHSGDIKVLHRTREGMVQLIEVS